MIKREKDMGADKRLVQEGYKVSRFWDPEVLLNFEGCIVSDTLP